MQIGKNERGQTLKDQVMARIGLGFPVRAYQLQM